MTVKPRQYKLKIILPPFWQAYQTVIYRLDTSTQHLVLWGFLVLLDPISFPDHIRASRTLE